MEPTAARNASRLPVFDPIKLDLAVMILLASGAMLVIARLNGPHWFELLTMVAVGVGSGTWMVFRTYRVVRTFKAHPLESIHGTGR